MRKQLLPEAATSAGAAPLALALLVGCAGPARATPAKGRDEIELPCRITARGAPAGKVRLTLKNSTKRSLHVLVGTGTPAVRVVRRQGDTKSSGKKTKRAVQLQAGFTCRRDYVHTCFHRRHLRIPARGHRRVTIDAPSNAKLAARLEQHKRSIACRYRTLHRGR